MDDLKIYAKENKVPIILDGGLKFLLETITENQVQTVLELGTAIGYSAIKMASISPMIKIDTIELNHDLYLEALSNIKNNNLGQQINCYNMNIDDFDTDKTYDLIFVDAAKAQYGKYLNKFQKNLNSGGIFFFDNIAFHGLVEHPELTKSRNTKQLVRKIKTFRDNILNNPNYECKFYPEIGDGIIILKMKKGDKI